MTDRSFVEFRGSLKAGHATQSHWLASLMMPTATLSLLLPFIAAPADAAHTLTSKQVLILETWLASQPGLRLALPEDCDCSEDIEAMRSGYGGRVDPVPDYSPYVATGDFNGDGAIDFAAVLIKENEEEEPGWVFGVFNGPFSSIPADPVFRNDELDCRRMGLFFGPPRPKPYRLLISVFESHGALLIPKNGTYELDWGER